MKSGDRISEVEARRRELSEEMKRIKETYYRASHRRATLFARRGRGESAVWQVAASAPRPEKRMEKKERERERKISLDRSQTTN